MFLKQSCAVLKILSVITVVIQFSSCSVQKDADCYEFCRRFNKLAGKEVLIFSDFYEKDGEYDFYTELSQSRPVLVSLTEDEQFNIRKARFTLIKNGNELTQSENEEILRLAVNLCSVLRTRSPEDEEILLRDKIGNGKISFCACSEFFSEDKYGYALICNSEIISFSCAFTG